jgi:hypothetical protein
MISRLLKVIEENDLRDKKKKLCCCSKPRGLCEIFDRTLFFAKFCHLMDEFGTNLD